MSVEAGAIVLIDEFPLRRAALKALLDAWLDPQAFTVFESDVARATVLLEVEPHASLLILNVGGGSLEDATHRHHLRLLRSVAPEAPLAILGERDSPEEIQVAIRLGAQAFLPASLEPFFVENCLSFLISGGSFFPTTALIAVAEEAADKGPDDEGPVLAKPLDKEAEPSRAGPARRSPRAGPTTKPRSARSPLGSATSSAAAGASFDAADRFSGQSKDMAMVREKACNGPAGHRSSVRSDDLRMTRAAGLNVETPCAATFQAQPAQSAEGSAQRMESASLSDDQRRAGRSPDLLDGPFAPAVHDVIRSLTPRQREVLELLAQGASNKEIARKLNATEPTVKIHVRQIIKRFGVSNRTQVVVSMFEKDREGEERDRDADEAGQNVGTGSGAGRSGGVEWVSRTTPTRSALGS